MSFAAITLCVAYYLVIPKVSVYFAIHSVRKLGYTFVYDYWSDRTYYYYYYYYYY
jgi:hypothetical protein